MTSNYVETQDIASIQMLSVELLDSPFNTQHPTLNIIVRETILKIRTIILALLALALTACGSIASANVARIDQAVLTRSALDARIDRIEKARQSQPAQPGQPLPSRIAIEQELVDQFISQNLLMGIAKQRGVEVSDKEIDDRITQLEAIVPQQSGQPLDSIIQSQLGMENAKSTDFRLFVSSLIAQTKLSYTLVPTDTLKQQITDEIMAQAKQEVEKADVAHILFQASTPEAEPEAKKKAEDVIKRLDAGEDFAKLAGELSEDPGSKDNGGLYTGITKGQFVPEFEQAMFEQLQPGEYTKEPVKTQFGYHVIKLIKKEKGPAMTAEQAQQEIDARLQNDLQQARGQALQDLITAEREKAKQEKRLEEPTYPTATVPPFQPPTGSTPEVPQAPTAAPEPSITPAP